LVYGAGRLTRPEAGPEDKAELYAELGVNLTYHPERRVSVEMVPRGVNDSVGGAIPVLTTRPTALARSYSLAL